MSASGLRDAVVILLGTAVVAWVVPRLLRGFNRRFRPPLRPLVQTLAVALVWLGGISVTLARLQVPLLAAFGVTVVGAALAAATLQVGQSLMGGIWLLTEGDLVVGDVLDVAGFTGTRLVDIRLRSLVVVVEDPVTGQRRRVTVPNALLMTGAYAVTVQTRTTGLDPVQTQAQAVGTATVKRPSPSGSRRG